MSIGKNIGKGSTIKHSKFGEGVIVDAEGAFYKVYFNEIAEIKEVANDFEGLELVESKGVALNTVTLDDVELALENVLYKMGAVDEPVHLGNKWIKGKILIQPNSTDLQGKEIPIEDFFHKIVMLRDRLRVLEQNINSHKKLDDEDKVHLQQYITRCYGSLTTFNILFRDKYAHFKGEGGKE